MTSLYAITDGKLHPATRSPLTRESLIEDWVAADPALLGLDALIIGRQVPTDHGKFIDLLAMDATGGLTIIELKKDRTPREIVAQVLEAYFHRNSALDPVTWGAVKRVVSQGAMFKHQPGSSHCVLTERIMREEGIID